MYLVYDIYIQFYWDNLHSTNIFGIKSTNNNENYYKYVSTYIHVLCDSKLISFPSKESPFEKTLLPLFQS